MHDSPDDHVTLRTVANSPVEGDHCQLPRISAFVSRPICVVFSFVRTLYPVSFSLIWSKSLNELELCCYTGSLFKQLLGMVSNMENEVPEDLKELLLPHLTHNLYDHQLASLHFVRKVSLRLLLYPP